MPRHNGTMASPSLLGRINFKLGGNIPRGIELEAENDLSYVNVSLKSKPSFYDVMTLR